MTKNISQEGDRAMEKCESKVSMPKDYSLQNLIGKSKMNQSANSFNMYEGSPKDE